MRRILMPCQMACQTFFPKGGQYRCFLQVESLARPVSEAFCQLVRQPGKIVEFDESAWDNWLPSLITSGQNRTHYYFEGSGQRDASPSRRVGGCPLVADARRRLESWSFS